VRIILDLIVEIIIPRILEKVVEVVRMDPDQAHHGLEVVIIPVVVVVVVEEREERFGIECDRMMIGEH
jgi:hypothetical protein